MWADILSGAFSGVNKGLGQVQDMRQQQFSRDQDSIRTQIAQKQQEQAMAEQKRRAVMEAYDKINGGQKLEVTEAQPYVDLGIKFDKDPTTGQLIKPKTRQEQLIEAQLGNVDLERQQNQMKLHAFQEVSEEDFYSRPIEQRLGPAGLAGVKAQTPREELSNSATLAAAQARAMYAGMPRPDDPATVALNRQKFMVDMRAKAMNMAKPTSGMFKTPQQIQQDAEMYYQQMVQAVGLDQQTPMAPGPAASGPPVGTKRMIQGVMATWDGKNWIG